MGFYVQNRWRMDFHCRFRSADGMRVCLTTLLAPARRAEAPALPGRSAVMRIIPAHNKKSIVRTVEIRCADDVLSCRFRAANGKGIFAWPKIPFIPKGHPASMACSYPTGPVRCEARLNSRFANVKSLRHCRRLRPRSGHPSACLTGPVGALVRWFADQEGLSKLPQSRQREPTQTCRSGF